MDRLTQKTSTILISAGDGTKVYRSVQEVPARLRRKLLESTSGANSATVLIADEGGRKQIMRSLQGLPTQLESRLLGSMITKLREGASADKTRRFGWRQAAEVVLIGGIGLCLWLLAAWK
ncbi:MAG: hypothetical protein JJE04_12040 [Acidobacteriia bacterium]|nr:hypothetical protein [Terriglobia bacterium]